MKKYITQQNTLKRANDLQAAHISSANQIDEKFYMKKRIFDLNWPQVISEDVKEKVIGLFREQTLKSFISAFTCAVCSEEILNTALQQVVYQIQGHRSEITGFI